MSLNEIIYLIHIFLFLKYENLKLKYNYSMYLYCIICD